MSEDCDRIKKELLETYGQEAVEYFKEYYEEELDDNVFISFSGQNCEYTDDGEFCSGWDGESRRCSCGNRRVAWDWDNEYLTAEAY
jgi:hypothetical protein